MKSETDTETDSMPDSAPASQSLNRAVKILQLVVASGHQGSALSDIVKKVGLTKPTTRRLLLALIDNGLLEQDLDNRRYFSGPETYALGVLASQRFGTHRIAADSLQRLAEQSGDAALLSVQRNDETVCLTRVEGTYPLRSHALQPGDRHPLGCGASGIALLAALPDEEVHGVLKSQASRLAANYPELTDEIIWRLVGETRERGYSLNPGLIVKGSWGIAVTVVDELGGIPATLAIAGVESRFTGNRIKELATLLNEEKARLEDRLRRR